MCEEPPASESGASDELLPGHHVRELSFTTQRAAIACMELMTTAELAAAVGVAENTARGEIARAIATILAGLDVGPNRAHLGRWARHHLGCCLSLAAAKLEDGTLFRPNP